MLYIASCSFGKDSMASIITALKHKERIDCAIYCKLWFWKEKGISAEYKHHEEFIENKAKPFLEKNGIKVITVESDYDYYTDFHHINKKGKRIGKKRGYLLSGLCSMNIRAKVKAIKEYYKTIKEPYIQYIGIAHDETKRLERLGENKISLLEKYKINEKDTYDICREYNMLSPMYDMGFTRLGCFFCPNSLTKLSNYKYMKTYMSSELNELVSWGNETNKTSEIFCFGKTIQEIIKKNESKLNQKTILDFC